ncbi:hypothetical protein HH310_27645 [Actinoplanes sp. TBRC 11911]|uniref:hypothetical protein n=1 Tax=Actinoplanes sp. TBRC 11911 TaxID=2729386 RepID=UPI00145F2ECB|nr:hypothetical protein [Actinoplanes sp. TBRC 11911]NMO54945.1 hypothetical protein [Actinoplanes sp. TBRC 11911]
MTISLDHSGSWTGDDLENLPEDNRRRELVDGSLILRASPTLAHQQVITRLSAALDESQPDQYHERPRPAFQARLRWLG